MESDDEPPGKKSPHDDDRSEWKAWGFIVGLIPSAFMLAAMTNSVTSKMKDSTMYLLVAVTTICVFAAGILFAKAAPKREHDMLLSQMMLAVAVAMGFAFLDVGIACVGCTCQSLHKL